MQGTLNRLGDRMGSTNNPAVGPSPVLGAGLGRRLPALERWLATIAALFGTDAALLMIAENGTSRVLSAYGIRHKLMTYAFDFAQAPYPRDATILLPDASADPAYHTLLADNALEQTHFFFRTPVMIEGERSIALIAFGREARPQVSEREARLAGEIAKAIASEFADLISPRKAVITPLTLGFVMQGLCDWIAAHPEPTALLDDQLNILQANPALVTVLSEANRNKTGQPMTALDLPGIDSLAFFFRRALETNTSTQPIEIAIEGDDGSLASTRYFSVMASPIQPVDRDKPCLVVTASDISPSVRNQTAFETANMRDRAGALKPAEATAAFLQETLVERRALRSRKGISFITVRAWRQPIRAHQIRALKALKASSPESLADGVAQVMQAEIESLLGIQSFRAIVPVPCGHSPPELCLSRAIALALGRRLQMPVIEALRLAPMRGSSHPKTNTKRPPMRLNRALDGPVLIIDDVATSGQHIEEACRLLRPAAGAALAMVWIGGDADQDED